MFYHVLFLEQGPIGIGILIYNIGFQIKIDNPFFFRTGPFFFAPGHKSKLRNDKAAALLPFLQSRVGRKGSPTSVDFRKTHTLISYRSIVASELPFGQLHLLFFYYNEPIFFQNLAYYINRV